MKYIRKFSTTTEERAFSVPYETLIYNEQKGKVTVEEATPPDDEIWYTSNDDNIVNPFGSDPFGKGITVVSNTYNNGKGVIKLSGNATKIGWSAFQDSNLKSINMPNGITYVDDSAFYGSFDLTKVKLSKISQR